MAAESNRGEKAEMEQSGNIYSDTVVDHAQNPRNVGDDPYPDGYAIVTGPCGDTMGIWLKVRGDVIDRITFWTDGCGPSIACGSIATEMTKGKSITAALKITQGEILDRLGGLPEESRHCALLAANTVKEAVRDYLSLKKEPWKKVYRDNK
jgi:nitrogen fixation NifU-like protein